MQLLLITPENTHYTIMLFVCRPKILHKHCLQFLVGVKMALRETENNTYANFWGDKQRALWYVMGFSGVVNCVRGTRTQLLLSVGCSVHYWVFCAINKRGFFEIAFVFTHICLALRRLLTFCLTLTH